MLDYASPFTFLFKDKDWLKKFAIASLLTYTVIGADPVMGWMVEIIRRMSQDEADALPDWREWKAFWRSGAKFLAVNILWLLPLLLALIIIYLPLVFANRLADEILLAVWGTTFFCILIFLLVYSLLYVFFLPAMVVRLARTGGIRASANPSALWKTVRPHFVEYLLVFLVAGLGVTNVSLLLAAATLFLLLPPILVYVGLVTAHFAGQLTKLGEN